MSAYNRFLRRNWASTAPNKLAARLDHVYCADHSRKTLISRQKVILGNNRKRNRSDSESTQKWIHDLQHYKRTKAQIRAQQDEATPVAATAAGDAPEASAALSKVILLKPDENDESGFLDSPKKEKPSLVAPAAPAAKKAKPEPELDPFAVLSTSVSNPKSFDVVSGGGGGGSEIESEDDEGVIDTWRGDVDSEAESIDSEIENPLKHAGGYSAEEVIRIMRDKLIRLQKSYIDQFQRLQYLLREERRHYKHEARREKETMMSIHQQPKPTQSEKSAYQMIKSLNHYNKPQGKDAVFASSVKQKRLKITEGSSYKPPRASQPKCSFNITSNTKCGEIVVPVSKYCMKHILDDPNQVLYRPCGVITEADESPCETPIIDVFEGNTCVYHTRLSQIYSQTNDEPSPSQPLPPTAQVSSEVIPKEESDSSINNSTLNSSNLLSEQQQQSTSTIS